MTAAGSLHVAIIMDGNGRWATSKALERAEGHRQGAEALRRVVEASPVLGIDTLTLYAFSTDNWKRPVDEVRCLLALFELYLDQEVTSLEDAGVRLSVIGRRDRLPDSLIDRIEQAEQRTAHCERLRLRLAIDYSGRDAIISAAIASLATGPLTRTGVDQHVGSGRGRRADVRDVDLLIRTGGEQRLSDFLIWESAYAELWFTKTAWPDFGRTELARAIADFARRERRYGALVQPQPPASAGRRHAANQQ